MKSYGGMAGTVALSVIALVAPRVQASTNTLWLSVPADSAWENAANWDNGVPNGMAVLFSNLATNGIAWLTNNVSSYTVNYTVPTNAFNKLILQNAGSFTTTLNINTNGFATLCLNEISPLGQLIVNANAIVNVNSNGVVDVGSGITLATSTGSGGILNVNKGGAVTWGERCSNQSVLLNGGTLNVYGSMRGALGIWAGNQGVTINNGAGTSTVNIDGGIAFWDGTLVANRGNGVLNITNNATMTIRNNGLSVGLGNNTPYVAKVNMSSGTVSNRSNLVIAKAPTASTSTGAGTLSLSGGNFVQFGVTTVGEARNGTLNISGSGLFVTTNMVFVGGTSAPSLSGSATASGNVNLTGGQLIVTNLQATATLNVGSAVTGTVTLAGGSLTVDRLTVTNMGASVFTFNSGTLTAKATSINNGVALTVGNGTNVAVLGLLTGTHSFANGLVMNTNAVFAVGGTNVLGSAAIAGNVTLLSGAVLDCDFNASTNDWTQIDGTLTLPESATLNIRTLDGSLRGTIPVMQATAISGDAGAWSPVFVNGWKYRAAVRGNQLRLLRVIKGTALSVN